MEGCRECNSLNENEQVVFNLYSDLYGKKVPMNGNVLSVDVANRKVHVAYLYGWKSENAIVDFYDMLAVYNPNGKIMKFDNISGRSDTLEGYRKLYGAAGKDEQ